MALRWRKFGWKLLGFIGGSNQLFIWCNKTEDVGLLIFILHAMRYFSKEAVLLGKFYKLSGINRRIPTVKPSWKKAPAMSSRSCHRHTANVSAMLMLGSFHLWILGVYTTIVLIKGYFYSLSDIVITGMGVGKCSSMSTNYLFQRL